MIHYQFGREDNWTPVSQAHVDRIHEGGLTTFLVLPEKPILFLRAHYDRLKSLTERLSIIFPWRDDADFNSQLGRFCEQALSGPAVVRILITGSRRACDIFYSVRPVPEKPQDIRLSTVHWSHRFGPDKLLTRMRETESRLAEIQKTGADDFLRLTESGWVAEAAYANVFWVDDNGTVFTPETEKTGALPGVIRQGVLSTCARQGIPVEVGCFEKAQLKTARGVFLSNAVRGLYPIRSIDDVVFEPEGILPLIQHITAGVADQPLSSFSK